jgi:hypothetical protein
MSIEQTIPPLRDLTADRLQVRKAHLIDEVSRMSGKRLAALSGIVGSRRRVAVAALAVGLLVIGTAVAATTGWLTGTPAPASVIADFGTYTPQVGYHPDPGSSVLVAESGGLQLYATTNAEGSYCVVASAPWKRPNENPDGGFCVPEKTAAQQIVAGIVGGSPEASDGNLTLLVGGRISSTGARTVRFTLPDGSDRSVKLGSSGFFVTGVEARLCQQADWTTKLVAFDEAGRQLAQSTLTLEQRLEPSGTHGAGPAACWLVPLTSEAAPSVRVGP